MNVASLIQLVQLTFLNLIYNSILRHLSSVTSPENMPYCEECNNRWFHSWAALDQHIANSDAHRSGGYDWECDVCDNNFKTERARHQHYSSAAGHAYCIPCERLFMNQNNLMQVGPTCYLCDCKLILRSICARAPIKEAMSAAPGARTPTPPHPA